MTRWRQLRQLPRGRASPVPASLDRRGVSGWPEGWLVTGTSAWMDAASNGDGQEGSGGGGYFSSIPFQHSEVVARDSVEAEGSVVGARSGGLWQRRDGGELNAPARPVASLDDSWGPIGTDLRWSRISGSSRLPRDAVDSRFPW